MRFDHRPPSVAPSTVVKVVSIAVLCALVFLAGSCAFKTVPAGHVGVATYFGSVQSEPYDEGLHKFINPLYQWTLYDVREKSHPETAPVPTQDQLSTDLHVSVQYRLNGKMAPEILGSTGDSEQMVEVHLRPKLRSLLREQGKSIKRAEDFFLEETQQQIQSSLQNQLQEYLAPKGIIVEAVLLRDIKLPTFITQAIERKKEREQAVEQQKAELERFTMEQQQKIAQAEAEEQAAESEAKRRKLMADAQAYEIQMINQAVSNNPAYVQLEALKTLQSISKDPATKMYFLNSDSPMPLPLMHMGDQQAGSRLVGPSASTSSAE
ncbi:prohibitin family protein [Planctomycetota bacterium]|nr:prohibitin family protein [Planctomycetota bacterium]